MGMTRHQMRVNKRQLAKLRIIRSGNAGGKWSRQDQQDANRFDRRTGQIAVAQYRAAQARKAAAARRSKAC